eukprot:TRINITY_DN6275_c0_g1_i1.p1 TRINITY_DN6275_c0_g1~~TRINITY_DN6275_c0_g1_i1.p1  ORF type:complete len:274 (+),score=71.62 TRINITY_DN6275_c0_g1_i1:35-856(+)
MAFHAPLPHLQGSFSLNRFQNALRTEDLGRSFIGRRTTTSTMEIAQRELDEGCPHGTLVFAEEQTQGQARLESRTWNSPPQGNLYLTLILRTSEESKWNVMMSLLPCSALALVAACRSEGVEAKIKWPNDVWAENRKLAGMIARHDGLGNFQLGIGINVNSEMSRVNTINAISVKEAAGRGIDRETFLANYLLSLEDLLKQSRERVLQMYTNEGLFKAGDKIYVHPHERGMDQPGYPAVVTGYSSSFELMVLNWPNTGDRTTLSPQEVSARPQ